MKDEELIARALRARTRAYTPYSHFDVGAALLTADGRVIEGCNVENASYGLTCCAERTAVFRAVAEGIRDFTAMAVISDSPGPASPCGACRQVLTEFNPDMRLILANLKGDVRVVLARDLLPGFFGPKDMA